MTRIRATAIFLVLAALSAPAGAQDAPPKTPKNGVEEFVSRKGVVLVKKMYDIKTFTWDLGRGDKMTLAVSAMHAYEAEDTTRGVFALRFEGQPVLGVSTTALLDLHSAKALQSALGAMIAQGRENASTTPEFVEVRFALGDSFECGFNQQGTVQRPFIVLGADLSRTLRSSRMADLEDLKAAVASEIEKLKELGAK